MNRTLVKSPPELWHEVSEVDSLARHLGEFGEIAITRLDPEHTVAWEGENARGTVELEAAGWGTKVTLNAKVDESAPAPVATRQPAETTAAPEPEPEPEPAVQEPDAPVAVRRSRFSRWFSRQRRAETEPVAVQPPAEPDPTLEFVAVAAPEPEPEPEAAPPVAPQAEQDPAAEPGIGAERAAAVLEDALENLGSAHHRPFSRG